MLSFAIFSQASLGIPTSLNRASKPSLSDNSVSFSMKKVDTGEYVILNKIEGFNMARGRWLNTIIFKLKAE